VTPIKMAKLFLQCNRGWL